MELQAYLKHRAQIIDEALAGYLPDNSHPLYAAMAYSLLGPGKRLRPVLCLAAHEAAGGIMENAMYCAVALEMIHCYSLIHDDLPAMDNDDFRRGRLTNHKVYGEALAVLAGDGLLTYALQILASPPAAVPARAALNAARLIAQAAGPAGMVGGQADDMAPREFSLPCLQSIHSRKTGAMISASLLAGAMLAGANQDFMDKLGKYGQKIGLAFQIADDMLDVQGSSADLGKSVGKDLAKGKLTYPALMGLEQSRALGMALVAEAEQLAREFNSQPLADLPSYIMNRKK